MAEVAFVTGAAKRIGRAITLALAEEGYDLALHYNRSEDEAEQLCRQVRDRGRRCRTFACDLTQTDAPAKLIDRLFEAFPECSLLVNNASVFGGGDFLETDPSVLESQLSVNFRAPFFLAQAFARRCSGGSVVNLLDAQVARTMTDRFAYNLSKKLLWSFTQMAAKALAPRIRVNAVCPGPILPSADSDREQFEAIARRTPLGRAGRPEQVARAVAFLARSEYITGQAIFVDGGDHLR